MLREVVLLLMGVGGRGGGAELDRWGYNSGLSIGGRAGRIRVGRGVKGVVQGRESITQVRDICGRVWL